MIFCVLYSWGKITFYCWLFHRSQQFEAEQAELHQKLAVLESELVVLKQQYDSMLEQVGQQQRLIQELSDLQETQKSQDKISHQHPEQTESSSECGHGVTLFVCFTLFECTLCIY